MNSHAGFEDAGQGAAVGAVAAGAGVQGVQVAAGPEGLFEFDGLLARAAHVKQLLENIGPADDGNRQQQRHDQLDDQVRIGDEGDKGEVLVDVHCFSI